MLCKGESVQMLFTCSATKGASARRTANGDAIHCLSVLGVELLSIPVANRSVSVT